MSAQTYFDELVSWATARLSGEEVLTASMSGEDSDFVRFNNGAVRQAGSVRQRYLSVRPDPRVDALWRWDTAGRGRRA